jgi:hypothetical protein
MSTNDGSGREKQFPFSTFPADAGVVQSGA